MPCRPGRSAEDVDAVGADVALAAAAAEGGRDDEILEHRHAAERLRDLERAREPEAAAPLRCKARHVTAGEQDAAGIGRERPGRDAEQRGLAGAVGPDDAERLAFGQRQVDVGRDHHGTEPLGDFFEREDGL